MPSWRGPGARCVHLVRSSALPSNSSDQVRAPSAGAALAGGAEAANAAAQRTSIALATAAVLILVVALVARACAPAPVHDRGSCCTSSTRSALLVIPVPFTEPF